MFTPSFTKKFPVLARLFAGGSDCIEYQPNSSDPERAAFGAEIEQLAHEPTMADELVSNVFPADVPTDVGFSISPDGALVG